MLNRRNFLEKSAKALAALGFTPLLSTCAQPDKKTTEITDNQASTPAVITTWGNEVPTQKAWEILKNQGYALDAVEAGVKISEADAANQYVGLGGFPDREGRVTLDASIMDEQGRGGCVAFLEDIKHPISVARRVMEQTPHVLLVGEGAQQFAIEQGFQKENLLTSASQAEYQKWLVKSKYETKINAERHDTIGMLSVDSQARLAGACTTSGMPFKMRGRVGDSPILGAGMYVDGDVGAATTSGLGELVLRTLGSFVVVEEMRRGAHPMEACLLAVKRIAAKVDVEAAQVGFVAINKKGEYGAYAIQPGFNFTLINAAGVLIQDAESLL